MPSATQRLTPFDLPEIASLVFEHVDKASLARCLPVCKAWHHYCLPLLWKSIIVMPNYPPTLYKLIQLDCQQHCKAHTHYRHLQNGAPLGLASSTQWVDDLRITAYSWRHGMIDIDVVHHLLQLCPNIRRLELDHYRKDTYTLEYCNPRLEALAVTGGFDQQLTQSVTMRFRGLRSLTFGKIDGKDSIPLMIEMIQGLPNLDKIGLSGFSPKLVDEDYAKLIAAGPKGWQQVELAHVGQTTIAAVAKHSRTLEFLSIRCISGFDSRQLVDLLASSPRLRTFRMLTNIFDAKSFVDPDLATTTTMTTTTARTLRPWLCEATLTEFRAHIGDIPRPDLTFDLQDDLHGNTADKHDRHDEDADDTDDDGDDEWCAPRLREAYPGESIHLQQQVLARLGRLRQLRRLQLGLEDLDAAERDAIKYSANYQAPFHDWHYQDECLDMTLASGLGQLQSLRQLRYLNIGRMASRVGPEEVEWMVQHWPQLETLEGLCADEEEEAAWQLWVIAPHINTIRFHRIT